MRTRHTVSSILLGLALAAGTAACGAEAASTGNAKLSPTELGLKTVQAIVEADTFRVRGSRTSGTTTVDLSVDRVHDTCVGTIDWGKGGRVEVIGVGGEIWLRPDQAYWKATAAIKDGSPAAERVRGRFLTRFNASPELTDLAASCHLQREIIALLADSPGDRTAGDPELGNPAGTVSYRISGDYVDEVTVFAAEQGTPYPVRLDMFGENGVNRLEFDRYNEPVTAQPPTADLVVDWSTLKR